MATYIMRWNPAISSCKIEDFRKYRKKWPNGFCYNWSIYEWENAHTDDDFYMVRVGDGPQGVVCIGHFLSEPYEEADWAGNPQKKRHYVDIACEVTIDPDEPLIPVEQLEALIPDINWSHGHSGEKLTGEQADKLHESFPLM